MVTRRIYLNLAAFALLFALLSVWAVQEVLRPGLLEETYRVDTTFADATGLRTGVEVTLRGVRVGRVASVDLADGGAAVAFDIEADTALPSGSGAAIRRRSAVGEPYVAIEPPAAWRPGDPTLPREGARIPIEATTTPLAYGELFSAADDLLQSTDPAALGTITRELALALGGRGATLARLVEDSRDATSTLAGGADELRVLGDRLTALTRTLADRSSTIANATDDLGLLVDTVAANADDLTSVLTTAPGLAERIDSILAASYGNLLCGGEAAATVSSALGSEETVTRIVQLLEAAETASVVIPQAIYDGPDGRYLSGTFGFAPGELNAYPTFEEFQEPPAMPECTTATPPPPPPVAPNGSASGLGAQPTPEAPDREGAAQGSAPGPAPTASADGTTDRAALVVAAAALGLAVLVTIAALLRGQRRASPAAGTNRANRGGPSA